MENGKGREREATDKVRQWREVWRRKEKRVGGRKMVIEKNGEQNNR